MPAKIVFGFGDPPWQLLNSLHHRAAQFSEPPLYYYQPIALDAAAVEKSCTLLRSPSVHGCHFTSALPLSAINWLDDVGMAARSSESIDVVYKGNKNVIGEDSALAGALRALRAAGLNNNGLRTLLIGAEYRALSLAHALSLQGMEQLQLLHISVDRVRAMASSLKRDSSKLSVMFGSLLSENLQSLVNEADLLIIAISPEDTLSLSALPATLILPPHLIIYNLAPYATTSWELSHPTRCILPHTLQFWQLAECYRLWNGQDPPWEVLRQLVDHA